MNTATAERELPDEIDVLKRIVMEQRACIEALTLFIAKLRRIVHPAADEACDCPAVPARVRSAT